MAIDRQYEMKFFLNTSKALTQAAVIPISYTWEINCKIKAPAKIDVGTVYQKLNQKIDELKQSFEKNDQFIIEIVAEQLFNQLTNELVKSDLLLSSLKVNASPMIGYEIINDR